MAASSFGLVGRRRAMAVGAPKPAKMFARPTTAAVGRIGQWHLDDLDAQA
ncbi:MAG: hypothetical protein IPP90_15875 [Gemmatimonadaceae bacterium]|nr:hypothetical protein [Gemmatimonadaceae bacterium]